MASDAAQSLTHTVDLSLALLSYPPQGAIDLHIFHCKSGILCGIQNPWNLFMVKAFILISRFLLWSDSWIIQTVELCLSFAEINCGIVFAWQLSIHLNGLEGFKFKIMNTISVTPVELRIYIAILLAKFKYLKMYREIEFIF